MSDARFCDFDALRPPVSPNWALAAPGAGDDKGGRRLIASPVYGDPPAAVIAALATILAAQPRTQVQATDDDGQALEAVARSALLRFTDRISARAAPLPDGGTGLWLYSRAATGYWDMGVNPRRVGDLLAALADRLDRR